MKRKYSDYLDASGNWQLLVDGDEDSWWDSKFESIERILELFTSENELVDFNYEGEILNLKELKYELESFSEEDFYIILEEIKKKCDFYGDIKLYNISDEYEAEFLKDEERSYYDFD